MGTSLANPPAPRERLEALWSGEFGDSYVERNRAAGDGRGAFWRATLTD